MNAGKLDHFISLKEHVNILPTNYYSSAENQHAQHVSQLPFVKTLTVGVTATCSSDMPNISLLLNPGLPQLVPTL